MRELLAREVFLGDPFGDALVRAREGARGDLMRARHRLSTLLLRYGIVYHGGKAWTGAQDVWLRHEALMRLTTVGGRSIRATFDNDYDALTTLARRDRLDAQIIKMAADSEVTPIVRRLGCLRGIATLTGFALAVEVGDWHRFTGNSIGSFVGLVPTEYFLGQLPHPRSDHQDRQRPRPAAPGRGRLAPPLRLPAEQGHARTLGAGPRRGTRAW